MLHCEFIIKFKKIRYIFALEVAIIYEKISILVEHLHLTCYVFNYRFCPILLL